VRAVFARVRVCAVLSRRENSTNDKVWAILIGFWNNQVLHVEGSGAPLYDYVPQGSHQGCSAEGPCSEDPECSEANSRKFRRPLAVWQHVRRHKKHLSRCTVGFASAPNPYLLCSTSNSLSYPRTANLVKWRRNFGNCWATPVCTICKNQNFPSWKGSGPNGSPFFYLKTRLKLQTTNFYCSTLPLLAFPKTLLRLSDILKHLSNFGGFRSTNSPRVTAGAGTRSWTGSLLLQIVPRHRVSGEGQLREIPP